MSGTDGEGLLAASCVFSFASDPYRRHAISSAELLDLIRMLSARCSLDSSGETCVCVSEHVFDVLEGERSSSGSQVVLAASLGWPFDIYGSIDLGNMVPNDSGSDVGTESLFVAHFILGFNCLFSFG